MQSNRRSFLRVATASLGLGAVGAGGAIAYGTLYEPRDLEIVHQRLSVPRLPPAFDRLKIGQISDLHLGRWVDAARVRAAVDTVSSLNPDVVVVTGDFVSRVTHGEADVVVGEFSRLKAPLGVFAILGNYDYLADADVVARAVERANLTLLRNSGARISRGNVRLHLAGIDDALEGHPDLGTALGAVPNTDPAILLAHEPDFADQASADPRIVLQLSGHSHGGQARIPGVGALYLPELARKYPAGLYRVRDTWLYTNRGIGVVAVPVRFDWRREVTLFELEAGRQPV